MSQAVRRASLDIRLQRMLLPYFAGVKRSLGIPKVPVAPLQRRDVATSQGPAEVTLYRPLNSRSDLLPIYLNFHGGGFIFGYPSQDDIFCRHFAHHARCLVVNVDYALAPERPFPAAPIQALEVAGWVARSAAELGADPSRMAVGGHSAGANLAAALCHLARTDNALAIVLQILAYGVFDLSKDSRDKHVIPSARQVLTPKQMNAYATLYTPNTADRLDELASPLLAKDFTGLPRALVITAENDLLKPDGEAYAARLATSGCETFYREFPATDHGFTYWGPKAQAHDALRLMTSELNSAFR